jgi:membrane-bound metal-dependent hydrolase YbcI (DUF457 family)
VDPASHLLFGRAVAFTLERRPDRRGVIAALVAGSIFPDIDAPLALYRFDLYLRAHAAGTHSLVGTLVGAVVLALTMRVMGRGSRLAPLFAASWVGTLGHVFWDIADGSNTRVLEPFSNAVFGWHVVTMAEPMVVVLLAATVVIAWRRPARARLVAGTGLALLSLLLGIKLISRVSARDRYDAAIGAGSRPQAVNIFPRYGHLFGWTVYDRAGPLVRVWNVNDRAGVVSLAFERQDAPEDAAVARSRELPVVRSLLGFAAIPFVRVETDGDRRVVLWSDVLECSNAGCGVSFGGVFDKAATPLYQEIRIGGFRQRRPVPRAP